MPEQLAEEIFFSSILNTAYRAIVVIKGNKFLDVYNYAFSLTQLYQDMYQEKVEVVLEQPILLVSKEWKGKLRNSLVKMFLQSHQKPEIADFDKFRSQPKALRQILLFDFLNHEEYEFNADILAFASSMLSAGGILLVLVPDTTKHLFLNYFLQMLTKYPNCFLFEQSKSNPKEFFSKSEELMDNVKEEEDAPILLQKQGEVNMDERLIKYIAKRKYSGLSLASSSVPEFSKISKGKYTDDELVDSFCRTNSQKEFIDYVYPFFSPNHIPKKKKFNWFDQKRLVFLFGQRGTGKSSAVALYIFRLLLEKKNNLIKNIVTTSNSLENAQRFFRALESFLHNAEMNMHLEIDKSSLITSIKRGFMDIAYTPIRSLISLQQGEADLLIIDEGGHIPIKHLKKLVLLHERVIIVNSTKGYNSTGNVLQYKFNPEIYELVEENQWALREFEFIIPMIYRQHDPLEKFVHDVFFLDNPCPDESPLDLLEENEFVLIHQPKEEILENPQVFSHMFGIFHNSFFVTNVKIVQETCENEALQLYGLYDKETRSHLLGAMLVEHQGGQYVENPQNFFEQGKKVKKKTNYIIARHHLDSLFLQNESIEIRRIAKNPTVQNDFIGSSFLHLLAYTLENTSLRFLTVSFNATSGLLRFWIRNSFVPLYISHEQSEIWDHPVYLLHPLDPDLVPAIQNYNLKFKNSFLFWLRDELSNLDPLSAYLLFTTPLEFPALSSYVSSVSEYTRKRLDAYFQKDLHYATVSDAINELLERILLTNHYPEITLSSLEKSLIIKKLQTYTWAEIAHSLWISDEDAFSRFNHTTKRIYLSILRKTERIAKENKDSRR